MQNAAFAALALDWAYVPLPVAAERLEDAVRGLEALGFAGANVTIPHKQAVVELCDELSEVAARAGSVNTLVFRTAACSATRPTARRSRTRSTRRGRALVLGAGGAARAVAAALRDAGAARCRHAAP